MILEAILFQFTIFIFHLNNDENHLQTSVETARDVQADKSLKTKAEKERIIREKNANNTKRFLDENIIKQTKNQTKYKKDIKTKG